jgi:hypothetical protein
MNNTPVLPRISTLFCHLHDLDGIIEYQGRVVWFSSTKVKIKYFSWADGCPKGTEVMLMSDFLHLRPRLFKTDDEMRRVWNSAPWADQRGIARLGL